MAHSLIFRGASISLCLLMLLPTLAAAAGPAPVGTLRSNGSVYIDATNVPGETSLFSGDHVQTKDGRASLTLGHGSSFVLEPSSAATLLKSAEGLSINLEKGRLAFSSNPKKPVQVESGQTAIVPTGKFTSLAEVAMLSNGSMLISVRRGAVNVRNGQEAPVMVEAGKQVTIGPKTTMKQDAPGTAAHGSKTLGQAAQSMHLSHGATVMVIGAAVAATAAAIAIPIAINNDESTPASPSTP